MSIDGMTLSLLKREIGEKILDSRVEKVAEPSKDEILISMRGTKGNYKLLFSSNAGTARVHITGATVENPAAPPMFCMLMRKLLGSARLVNIRQRGFERILFFDFKGTDELGDEVVYTLIAEVMGRHSNVILTKEDGKIIDALKRVGMDKSSVRQILPGLEYVLPPQQDKIPLCGNAGEIVEKIKNYERDIPLNKALCEVMEGIAPVLGREVAYRALKGCDGIISSLTQDDLDNLRRELEDLDRRMNDMDICPTVFFDHEDNPKDFSFLELNQYEGAVKEQSFGSLNELCDFFYSQKALAERMKQKMADFAKNVTNKIERIEKKINLQKNELLETEKREEFKVKGDLLSSYLYLLKRGMTEVKLENYYDNNKEVVIALDPLLNPVGNVQKYYKEYRRADTANKELTRLIKEGEEELKYLYSVFDMMERSTGEKELTAIRQELVSMGYLKRQGKKKEKEITLPPIKYLSSDGFIIYSGRNNVGNDRLTFKIGSKLDTWFHVQKIPGSHTVIISGGREIPEQTIFEAATIAACNSSGKESGKVSVDYTIIKNVKKPSGAKPGMVIYDNYKTMVVSPDKALAEKLLEK